jgi:hypothetical protein
MARVNTHWTTMTDSSMGLNNYVQLPFSPFF